ncbi:hypothetical protein BDF21DRAFT_158012 [Thamnidium elegans]|nr:hypothetical protein BDF21DRAFT_158012 [Thamnidium elegans]
MNLKNLLIFFKIIMMKMMKYCSWVLYTTETSGFWLAQSLSGNIRNDVNMNENVKFINSNASTFIDSSYSSKRAREDSQTIENKRATLLENDDIFLDGLNVSVFTFLKRITSNSLSNFNRFNDKENYFTTITMNNVCDLTDDTPGSQLSHLTFEQKDQLKKSLSHTKRSSAKYDDNIKKCFSNIKSNDIGSLFGKVNALTLSYSKNDIAVSEVYRLLNHLFSPELFSESKLEQLSEFDYILYFWGPVINDIFLASGIWAHWHG